MRSKSAHCVLRLPPHAVHLRLAQGFRRTLARQRRPALVPQRGSDAWCRCSPRLGPPILLTCLTGSHRINADIPTRRRCALGNRQSQSAIHLTEGQGEQGARRATMTNRSRSSRPIGTGICSRSGTGCLRAHNFPPPVKAVEIPQAGRQRGAGARSAHRGRPGCPDGGADVSGGTGAERAT
jgi:hypothetical protein